MRSDYYAMNRFECEYCGEFFDTEPGLMGHRLGAHNEDEALEYAERLLSEKD